MGGRTVVKSMRKVKVCEKSDERILGDGDFVDQVLSLSGVSQSVMRGEKIAETHGYALLERKL